MTFALLATAALAAPASAGIVGFHESFSSGAQQWRNFNGTSELLWNGSGGPDDSAYVSGLYNLSPTTVGGFPPTVIRAAQSYGSSDGSYAGNWIEAGVTGVGFWFRHDLSQAITVTGRFATPVNTPGASVISTQAVQANTWTFISFDLTQGSSQIVSLGGGTYNSIFSNIGNMQIGFMVPAALAGQNVTGTFSMTGFTVVPAPGAMALAALAGGIVRSRRR